MGEYEYRIVNLMEERGMSQAELSRRSGITTSSLNRYLAGTDIPASKLKAMADALGVTVDAILGTGGRLEPDEYDLLSTYRELSDSAKEALLTVAHTLAGGGR